MHTNHEFSDPVGLPYDLELPILAFLLTKNAYRKPMTSDVQNDGKDVNFCNNLVKIYLARFWSD